MKKGLFILAAAIVAGVLAFFLSRSQPVAHTDPALIDSLPELAWLRSDLKLTDGQFSKIEQLHRDYRPVCAEMCRRIAASEASVAQLASVRSGMSDDLAKAIEEHGRVIAECKRSMLEHLYQTASLMDERQAGRYLKVTLPLALGSAHGPAAPHHHE